MNDEQQVIARNFVNLFAGNGSAYGTEQGGCVHSPITWDVIEGHLFGDSPIGVYPMQPTKDGPFVKWGCVDYDEGDEVSFDKARRLIDALKAIGIPAFPERSRSKGWHVWVFAAAAVPARNMRRALLAACQVAKAESKEVNPKAEEQPEGFLGNYVRLPYPHGYDADCSIGHAPTLGQGPPEGWGRRCIWRDFSVDWMPIDLESFLGTVQLASPSQIEWAASLWKAPVSQSRVELNQEVGEEPTALIQQLPGLAFTIWKEGPLDGSDRSSTLMRLCREVHDFGFTPDHAFQVVASADRRWGKYSTRPDGGAGEISKIVRRVYQ